MPTPNIAKTTTFRLTVALGVTFGAAIILLLGLVYAQASGVLSRRVDGIVRAEAAALGQTSPDAILRAIKEQSTRDPLTRFTLFADTGERVAGPGGLTPALVPLDGRTHDFPRSTTSPPQSAFSARMPWGEVLIVQRDTSQLIDIKLIIFNALLWSGALIAVFGAFLAVVLSLAPLRRVRSTQRASEAIAGGDLTVRLPVEGSGDELDELARIVNTMMDEVERLVTQARTVGEGVAHELRTPLTRLKATLDHIEASLDPTDPRRDLVETCVAEADAVLARFKALLRIAAVESRGRTSAIEPMSLSATLEQVIELYAPLALERQINLHVMAEPALMIRADTALMFEALSNLIDNALKFTPAGGTVEVRLALTQCGPLIEVQDSGLGITPEDRPFITKRFFRSQTVNHLPGHGLGLSLVAAVADLHNFTLSFGDAAPGALVKLLCARPNSVVSS